MVAPQAERWPRSLLRRLDSPWAPVACAAVLFAVFLGARLENHWGNPSAFIYAGDQFCDPALVDPNLLVGRNSSGYDGQFYYRLALDPFTREQTAFGVRLDNPPYRQQRILYPLLAWVVSLGRPAAVPAALIFVNYLGLCVMAWMSGACCQAFKRHALYGLLIVLYPGFVLSLARDTSEIVSACFLLGGVLALHRRKAVLGAAALTLAILARETALGLIVAMAIARPRSGWTKKSTDEPGWLVIAAPAVVFGLWQIVLLRQWGSAGVSSGQVNLDLPLAGLTRFLRTVSSTESGLHDLWLGEVVFLAVFSVCVLLCIRRSAVEGHIKLAWLLYAGLASVLSGSVWIEDWAFLRALTEFYLLGALILIGSSFRGSAILLGYAAAIWFVVMRSKLH